MKSGKPSVYFATTKAQKGEYNIRLLKSLCEHYGVATVDSPELSECVWVSCCDTIDLVLLKNARKYNKPIVAGGSITYMPVMRFWADYVCNGEAYNFIERFAKIKHIEEVVEFEQVSTKDKIGVLDEYIDYTLNPIIQASRRAYYYYCGKGCPQLCQYCALSWSRSWQQAPQILVERAIDQVPETGKFMPMVSFWNYKLPLRLNDKLGILDVKIKEYLSTGGYLAGHFVRTGIEFVDESLRSKLAKPLSMSELNAFIYLTKMRDHEAVLYFIAGLEDEEAIIDFFDKCHRDISLYPRLNLAFTYFESHDITPMGGFNRAERKQIDIDRIFKNINAMNRRYRTHKIKYIAHSTWRTLMGRVQTKEDADYYWSLRTMRDNRKLLDIVAYRNPEYLGTVTLDDLLSRPRVTKKVKIHGS